MNFFNTLPSPGRPDFNDASYLPQAYYAHIGSQATTDTAPQTMAGSSTTMPTFTEPCEAQPSTGARARRRGLGWEQYKAELRALYLDDDETLEDIRELMRSEHSFDATAKQYKEQFKLWGWQKYLPGGKAQWIVKKADKRKREDGKDTVFYYGGRMWPKERAEASAKRSKAQDTDSVAMDVDTPEGVSYKTPAGITSPDNRRKPSMEAVSSISSPNQAESDDESEVTPLSLTWNEHSKADLSTTFETAKGLARSGNSAGAEELFLQALKGYCHVLSPTHEETCNVVYALATFYAEQQRMPEANKVFENCNKAHIERWGIEHKRTQQHVLHVVQLLNGWQRAADALAFLAHARELVEVGMPRNVRGGSGKKRGKGPFRPPKQATRNKNVRLLDIANSMIDDGGPSNIDYGIGVARTYVLSKEEAVEPLLLAMIGLCQADQIVLAVQWLRAWTELLKLYEKLETVFENYVRFDNAREAFDAVLQRYPWESKKFKSLEVMEVSLELAAAFLKSGYTDEATKMFRDSTNMAEHVFGTDDERTIWAVISVGLVYQSYRGWESASAWFQQALAAAAAKYNEDDGVRMSLESAIENRHFSWNNDEGRPFTSIFGVNGITIRPGRLHLE